MNKKIFGIYIVMLLIASGFVSVNSITAKNEEMMVENYIVTTPMQLIPTILSDNFNDNSKNYAKWSELYDDGEWFERNQRCEFQLHELDGTTYSEGIESSSFSVSMGHSTSVIVSADMITDIFHSPGQYVGQLHMKVTDGYNSITASYYRNGNDLSFSDSKGGHTVLNSNQDEGSWKVQIEIRREEYRVIMNSIASDWIDYEVFYSANPTLKIQLYMHLAGDYPDKYWIAGFDNLIVLDEGQHPVVDFSYERDGYTVDFDASTLTYDPDGEGIAMYFWNFGDNSLQFGGATASHTYTRSGTFKCELEVIDDDGEEWQAIHYITVPYHEKLPKLDIEIKDSHGKIVAEISNIGEYYASKVDWTISAEGVGLKGLICFSEIELSANGDFYYMPVGGSKTVTSAYGSIDYTLGFMTITVTATMPQNGEDPIEKTEKALALILNDKVMILRSLN